MDDSNLDVRQLHINRLTTYNFLKRSLDIILSGSALIVLSPILLSTGLILRFTGEGAVFFKQERTGRNRKSFMLLKFVTMQRGSEKISSVTSPGDPRVLPFGKFLRKTKINELPQLINVLLGDMSVIGFRPLVEESFQHYTNRTKACMAQMKPGLSGIGSIVFRDEESILRKSKKPKMDCYIEDITPLKGALEEWYFENRSFGLDLKIIVLTLFTIFASNSKFYLSSLDIRKIIEESTLKEELLN